MSPSVFICDSASELIRRSGRGESVLLGADTELGSAGPKILKAAAPLCQRNWRIYIERSKEGSTCSYGVFFGTSDPSALTVDEILFEETARDFPIVRISQSAINKVELRSNSGKIAEFRFNDDEDVDLRAGKDISGLANAIGRHAKTDVVTFSRFVERLLSAGIRSGHGTLVAVTSGGIGTFPRNLDDAVVLSAPIDLAARYERHLDEGRTADSMSSLQAAVELVAGFIASDGITVFSDAGLVLGYRAFVRSGAGSQIVSTGGARTRAYQAMKTWLGNDLVAAFFRSQDGRTEFCETHRDGELNG